VIAIGATIASPDIRSCTERMELTIVGLTVFDAAQAPQNVAQLLL
jgi:hypothetical protein